MHSNTRSKRHCSPSEGWTRKNRGPILAKKPCSQPQDRVTWAWGGRGRGSGRHGEGAPVRLGSQDRRLQEKTASPLQAEDTAEARGRVPRGADEGGQEHGQRLGASTQLQDPCKRGRGQPTGRASTREAVGARSWRDRVREALQRRRGRPCAGRRAGGGASQPPTPGSQLSREADDQTG